MACRCRRPGARRWSSDRHLWRHSCCRTFSFRRFSLKPECSPSSRWSTVDRQVQPRLPGHARRRRRGRRASGQGGTTRQTACEDYFKRSVLMPVNLCPQVMEFAKKMTACHKGGDKKLRFSIIGAADRCSCCQLALGPHSDSSVMMDCFGFTMQATPWAACTRGTASATSTPRDFLTSGNLSYASTSLACSRCPVSSRSPPEASALRTSSRSPLRILGLDARTEASTRSSRSSPPTSFRALVRGFSLFSFVVGRTLNPFDLHRHQDAS